MKPQLFGLESYFLFWCVAAIFGIGTGMRSTRRTGLTAGRSFVALCIGSAVILLGSKLLYLTEHILFPLDDPVMVAQDSLGLLLRHGFRLPGGVLLLALAMPATCWILGFPTLRFMDAALPAVGVAVCCVRIGCFLNGCCYGAVTEVPFAVTFPPGARAYNWQLAQGLISPGAVRSLPVHPLQLYFALVGAVLYVLARRWYARKRFDGQVWVNFYLVFFGATFPLELLRPTPLHLNLIITAATTVVTLVIAAQARRTTAALAAACS